MGEEYTSIIEIEYEAEDELEARFRLHELLESNGFDLKNIRTCKSRDMKKVRYGVF